MREYTVIYERAKDGGWGAYVPDLPGLGVVGDTREEAHQLIVEGISDRRWSPGSRTRFVRRADSRPGRIRNRGVATPPNQIYC